MADAHGQPHPLGLAEIRVRRSRDSTAERGEPNSYMWGGGWQIQIKMFGRTHAGEIN